MGKTISTILCFILLALSVVLPVLAYENLSPAEVKQKLDAKEDVFVLDVRQPEEYAQGYVPTAYLLPLGEIEQRLDEVPRDKQVIVVCGIGGRSAAASQTLDDSGFDNIFNMPGGMMAWIDLPAYVNIKGADLWDQLTDPDAFILDVRKADEYAAERIAEAISIPFDELIDRLDEVPQDKEITVIGKDDPEGAQVAEELIKLGYTGVRSLEGGMMDWDLATAVSAMGKRITTFAAIKTALSD
ncbi:rhodanese-like domain-containing protein [Candidatus Poribacteria bacterium]